MSALSNAAKQNRSPRSGSGRRPRRRRSHRKGKQPSTLEQIVQNFACCGRCSFFLGAYRFVLHPEQFAAAVAATDGEWLLLAWDGRMRDLVNKSYGCRIDVDAVYLDGTCPECQREFLYAAATEADETAEFRIRV